MSALPERSYARANTELIDAFERYLESIGSSPFTRRKYLYAVRCLAEAIGSANLIEVERPAIRVLFTKWQQAGRGPASLNLLTCGLKSFFKFVNLAGLTRHNPMFLIRQRKVPTRVPIVLTVDQVEKLIDAGQDPFERACAEMLYSTGVRVSELCKLRLEDIHWDSRSIRVHKGKGGKDRVVLFGSYAEKVIREYQEWRPSKHGYLFEAPARIGMVHARGMHWYGCFYVKGVQREISIGPIVQFPTKAEAREEFNRIAQQIPGFRPVGARPYSHVAIRNVLNRLARRAGIEKIHPHALRRAMASHMLQRGANLRAVQELLGHERLSTTMRYTELNAEHIREVHRKFHPHEQGGRPDDEKQD